jgi:hypothetical protein
MSARNGDRSRFHRERKQKIARRKRNRELLKGVVTHHKSASVASGARTEAVTA